MRRRRARISLFAIVALLALTLAAALINTARFHDRLEPAGAEAPL